MLSSLTIEQIDAEIKRLSAICRGCGKTGVYLEKGRCSVCRRDRTDRYLEKYLGRTYWDTTGYIRVYAKVNGKNKVSYLHREIMRDFLKEKGDDLQPGDKVIFRDRNKTNCQLSNLSLIRNGLPLYFVCPHCQEPIQLST